jgi:hypothetical protein
VPSFPRRAIPLLAAVLAGVSLLAACSASASPPNPSSACNGADEQSAAGFYPGLEAMLPAHVGSQSLTSVRSGRYCSAQTLGSLTKVGIHELQFAGGALPDPTNEGAGMALIVYRASGMTLDELADAQANGAGNTQGAAGVTARQTSIAGHAGIRIDVTVQSGPEMMFFWPTSLPGTFDAVTGIGASEAQIQASVASFGTVPGAGSPGGASPPPSSPRSPSAPSPSR